MCFYLLAFLCAFQNRWLFSIFTWIFSLHSNWGWHPPLFIIWICSVRVCMNKWGGELLEESLKVLFFSPDRERSFGGWQGVSLGEAGRRTGWDQIQTREHKGQVDDQSHYRDLFNTAPFCQGTEAELSSNFLLFQTQVWVEIQLWLMASRFWQKMLEILWKSEYLHWQKRANSCVWGVWYFCLCSPSLRCLTLFVAPFRERCSSLWMTSSAACCALGQWCHRLSNISLTSWMSKHWNTTMWMKRPSISGRLIGKCTACLHTLKSHSYSLSIMVEEKSFTQVKCSATWICIHFCDIDPFFYQVLHFSL